MNTWDSFIYLKKVDKQAQELRDHCLGYHVPLVLLLPENCRALSAQQIALQLAQQLLFGLAEYCPEADRDELEHLWQWLSSMLLYLFRKYSQENQTVGALIRLAKMDYFERHSMYRDIPEIGCAIRDDLVAPSPLSHLDITLLTMLEQNRLLETGKDLCRRLEAML